MKIAVVGAGIIGKRHLSAIEQSRDFELCAICDVNPDLARDIGAQYQVPFFTDYHDIPTLTQAEAVILNLPHWLHCDASVYFLAQGLHVLVEKPMANTYEQCRQMLNAAQSSGKKLAVGHIQRFFSANIAVKALHDSGKLGRLCMVTEFRTIDYFTDARPKWFLDRKLAGGGIVMNYGAHALDKLQYITGRTPQHISATAENFKNDATIEGHAQIYLRYDNGLSAGITFSGYGNFGYETVYYFTHGALRVSNGYKLFIREGDDWVELPMSETDEPICLQLEEFGKFLRDEPNQMPTAEYGARIISTIEQIYEDYES